jgi:hypothetical protein
MPYMLARRAKPAVQVISIRAMPTSEHDWHYCFLCERVFQLQEAAIEISHAQEHLGYLCPRCQGSSAAQLRPKLFKLATALEKKAQHIRALALLEIVPLPRTSCT